MAEQFRDQEPLPLEVVQPLGDITLRLSVLEAGSQQPEIFDTIQGEGRHLGMPTAFMRLSECNQNCSWCDTPFTWAFTDDKAAKHNDGVKYDRADWQVTREAAEMADAVYALNQERVVVTGGEPLMQQKAVVAFADELRWKNPDYHVEIETAGTIVPSNALISRVSHFNVSPKLSSSGNDVRRSLKPAPLKRFAELPNADFKFVVTNDADIREIMDVVEMSGIPANRVFLMPEGRTQDELSRHGDKIAQLCKEHGFNMTTRLHIMLWGDKKNV